MALKDSDKRALGFLGVAGVGALIYLQIMPMYDDYTKRQEDILGLVEELRVAHKKAENMRELIGEVDLLKYRLAELKKILPTEEGSFELIDKMEALAKKSGVNIQGITIEDRKEKGEGWTSIGFRVEGDCYWYQLIEFLWGLENYERLIDILSINLNPVALLPGDKIQKFTISIVCNVYSSTQTET